MKMHLDTTLFFQSLFGLNSRSIIRDFTTKIWHKFVFLKRINAAVKLENSPVSYFPFFPGMDQTATGTNIDPMSSSYT
jgi:hypothetical protein